MKLSNFQISTKVFAVVGILSMGMLLIGGMGFVGLSSLVDATREVDTAGTEVKFGSRLSQNVLELSRAEYRLASQPGDFAEVEPVAIEAQKEFKRRLENAQVTAGPNQTRMLQEVTAAFDAYIASFSETLELARTTGEVERSDGQKRIADMVASSRPLAAALREKVAAYVDYTDSKGDRISQETSTLAVTLQSVVAIGVLAFIVLGFGAGYVIAKRGITGPLSEGVSDLRELAEGKLDLVIRGLDRNDEVGDIARTMEVFKANAIARKEAEEREEIEARKQQERAEKIEVYTREFDTSSSTIVSALAAAATELRSSAESMSRIVNETSERATAVAAAAEQASANVETVAAATEELSAASREIGQQVNEAARVSTDAVNEASEAQKMVQGLANSSVKIGDVVSLITAIAEQTNLLALNATIEAARAGDAGKGFAVVASEVKSLANQTSKATEDIRQQIEGIQGATKEAVLAIERIGSVIGRINEISTAISSAVEEQQSATQEIARNIEEASIGTREVSTNIQGVNEAAEESSGTAEEVLGAASDVSKQSEVMGGQVDDFLTKVRVL